MSNTNTFSFTGRVGNIEAKQVGDQTIASVSVAYAEHEKQSDGSWGETTTWHKVDVFGKQAERILNEGSLQKGYQVFVTGSMHIRKGTGQHEGKEFRSVRADRIEVTYRPKPKEEQF